MAVRQTGCAVCAASVQEAQDFCADRWGYAEKPRSRLFILMASRTSRQINKIIPLTDETILNLMRRESGIDAHRARALDPEHPVIRGTSANPDTYFQSREATTMIQRRL